MRYCCGCDELHMEAFYHGRLAGDSVAKVNHTFSSFKEGQVAPQSGLFITASEE